MICPRCGYDKKNLGAISRRDNETHICSGCGNMEALFDWKMSQRTDKTTEEYTRIMEAERGWLQNLKHTTQDT